jgi:hypothetical protein
MAIYALRAYFNDILHRGFDFPSLTGKSNIVREVFTEDEIGMLLKNAGSKYRVLFSLMYHFEWKRGEVLELRKKDISRTNEGILAVKFGPIPQSLPASLSKELDDYLRTYNGPSKWLFPSDKEDKPLSGESVDIAFKKALVQAKLTTKKLTTESLRKSHAEHSKRAGTALIDKVLEKDIDDRPNKNFVDLKRINELQQIQSDKFDLCKLIRFCEELNGCYLNEEYLATSLLIRAVLDHVSPIFGFNTFSQVVSNYAGGKSFKAQMEYLENSSRKIADGYLHLPIRKAESLPNQTQVNFANPFDVLLAEVVRVLK